MAKEKKEGDVSSATTVVGEEKAPITTLALGEEHVITTLVGEQVQAGPELAAVADQSGGASATTVVGEAWHPHLPVTTLAIGEENPTTYAIGEEGPPVTTTALGEEGPITTIVGEHSHIGFTTTVVGEEGPVVTTLAGEQHHVPVNTTVAGEDVPGGGGPGGAFGQY
jgi:hypothetical protein